MVKKKDSPGSSVHRTSAEGKPEQNIVRVENQTLYDQHRQEENRNFEKTN